MHQPIHERNQAFPVVEIGAALRNFFAVVDRRWRGIARFTALAMLVAAVYALTAEPKFTSNASIIIDPRTRATPDGPETAPLVMTADALIVDSEVQVLNSREVTGRAVEALGLYESTEPETPGLVSRLTGTLRGLLGGGEDGALADPNSAEEIRRETIRRDFAETLDIERSADTYVIGISYTSTDRAYAAQAANAVVQAYLATSTERRSEEFDRLNLWVGDRLERIEAEVREAEAAIAAYRRDNDLFELVEDQLPSQAELQSATETLINTRNQIVALGVKIDQLDAQIGLGDPEGVNIAPEDRTVALAAFEERYAELLQQEMTTILSRGEGSAVVRDLRRTQVEIRDLILDELTRIRDRMVSQRATLLRRAAETELVIESLRIRASEDAEKLIELRRLERQAVSKQVLFEDLLSSFDSSAELASFDGSPARVIAWAVPPDQKSAPQSALLVLLSGVAFTREAFDNSLRTPDELQTATGINVLGVVPDVASERKRLRELGFAENKERLPGSFRKLGRSERILRYAADNPRSIMAETLSALQIQLHWGRKHGDNAQGARGMTVGFLSSVADEGKTTIAMNYATMLAQQSARVLLIDLDLIKSETTRALAPILPPENMLSALMLDPDPNRLQPMAEFEGLTVVGNNGNEGLNPADPMDAEDLEDIIDYLKDHYDFIVLDIPPLQGMAESRVLARLCDKLIYVVHWGSTLQTELASAMRQLRGLGDRIIGAVYSRANLDLYLKYNQDAVKGTYYR